ncbi:DUF3883 domain-containing protein [Phenylobacterium sp.]|uniref:DUF3883 domain-containing protein n=1 Tax=Phenylobacterium sp. TaxID=1871053 RepID=UPI0025E15766|nr:DUF3883 domain-containing protein [Phenylobacterium sp.]
MTSGGDWTDAENDRIVASYFDMLVEDLAKRPYNKAAFNRALQVQLPARSRGAIEWKLQNISAILREMSEDWIPGYKPAVDFQESLIDAVIRHPKRKAIYAQAVALPTIAQEVPVLFLSPPPLPLNRDVLPEKQRKALALRFDPAEADARNRELGRAGEELVLGFERHLLRRSGRSDLADQVRWTSQEDGDGAGYDIASFTPEGRPRLVEVKTTNGWERSAFHISRNELDVANDNRESWRLVRVWNFAREPRAFELAPPLDAHVRLTPTNFLAAFG